MLSLSLSDADKLYPNVVVLLIILSLIMVYEHTKLSLNLDYAHNSKPDSGLCPHKIRLTSVYAYRT
jgi:hypothetical protein